MIIAGSERRDIEPHKIYGEILIIRRRYHVCPLKIVDGLYKFNN